MSVNSLTPRLHSGQVLGAAAFLALPLEILSWPSITPVMVAATLGMLFLNWRRLGGGIRHRWLLAVLATLAVYGCISASWSLEPPNAFRLGLWLLGIFAAGLALLEAALTLTPEERKSWERGLIAGFLLGLVMLEAMLLTQGQILEYLRNLPAIKAVIGAQRPYDFPAGLDTSITLALFLAWSVIAVLLRRGWRFAALAALVVSLAVVAQGSSMTSFVAYVAGIVVYAVARMAPRTVTYAIGAALAIWIAAAPAILSQPILDRWTEQASPVLQGKESSLAHRLSIWRFVIGKIEERPLLGWGLDSSRWMPGGHTAYNGSDSELLPLHPHDAALQLRLDLGWPGVAIGIAFILGLTRALVRWNAPAEAKATALAFLAGASLLAAASYNLWHIWWLTMLWLGAVFAAVALRGGRDDAESRRLR